MACISSQDIVFLRSDRGFVRTARANEKKVALGKTSFSLEGAIGKPYGTTFEIDRSRLVPTVNESSSSTLLEGFESGIDNKDIYDDGQAQRLNRDEITALKQEGASAKEIVEQLMENSSTFKERTEYSQAKYIKRKLIRHRPRVTIVRPSTRLVCEMCWTRSPSKSLYMRVDTLAQMLTIANVHSGCNVMLVESCQGLLTGAVLERLGGCGRLIQITHNEIVVRPALDALHLSDDVRKVLMDIQLKELDKFGGKLEAGVTADVIKGSNETCEEHCIEGVRDEKAREVDDQEILGRKRRKLTFEEKAAKRKARTEHIETVNRILMEQKMDSLIVASKYHPWPIVSSLLDYIAPSRQIVIYSQHQEPLVECYSNLRSTGCVVNWKLSDTWFRHYQVLPQRTHPMVNMSATGGYILSATTVASSQVCSV